MWAVIGKLFLGGVGTIAKEIRGFQQDKLNAKNQTERIDADKAIAALEARQAVMVAEAGKGWNIIFRMFLATPFGLFWWKVLVWDKMLGLGATADLSTEQYAVMGVVYSFYFLYEIQLKRR